MFLDNKYARWYHELMQSRKTLKREGYLEKHHIIPKSLGGPNIRSNLVWLTAREHFIAHLLLVKALPSPFKRKMQFALLFLRGKGRGRGRQLYTLTSRVYEFVKKQLSEANSGRQLSDLQRKVFTRKGCKNTLEHNRKIGEAHKGKVLSDETKRKMSISKGGDGLLKTERPKKPRAVRRFSDVAKANISAARRGANNPRAKVWVLEREDGTTFEVKGLKPWCKERGISFDAICRRDGRWFSGVRLR